jgi:hypothetical protein
MGLAPNWTRRSGSALHKRTALRALWTGISIEPGEKGISGAKRTVMVASRAIFASGQTAASSRRSAVKVQPVS